MKNKNLIILLVGFLVVAALVVHYRKPVMIEIPPAESAYLQTRVDGDLFVAKDKKLERLFVLNGTIKREEVSVIPSVPEGSFYSFVGSYGTKLVTAYNNSPVIEIFESNHFVGPKSVYKISLDEGACVGCSSLDNITIKNGQLLYIFSTSERANPTFYYVIDLTKESIVPRQISKEEWNSLN